MKLTVREIAAATGAQLLSGSEEVVATSCVIDSREVRPGALFAAFIGERSDGHDYVPCALEAGASVILVSQDMHVTSMHASVLLVEDMLRAIQDLARYQRSRLSLPVIGITGSTGKTSTKELLAAALSTHLRTVATVANYNNELGVPLTVLAADENTQVLIVEMGMRARGEIALLADIAQPQIGIITTLGEGHIERLGSRENIARAKAELFEVLPVNGLALCESSVAFKDLLRAASCAPLVTVGIAPLAADLTAHELNLDKQACPHARVTTPAGETHLALTLPGTHSILNALFALAVGLHLKLPLSDLSVALNKASTTGMRLRTEKAPALGISILNDAYNANPDSTAAALRTLAAMQSERRIAVLGDMLELGTESQRSHQAMLALAVELKLDAVYTYGEHYAAITSSTRAFTRMDVLLPVLLRELKPGDMVLVKGSRGMRMERIVDALLMSSAQPLTSKKDAL